MADKKEDKMQALPGKPTLTRGELKRRTVTVMGIVVALVTLFLLLWYLAELLLAVFGGILFAIILSYPTDLLRQRTGLRRGVCLGIVVLALLVAAIGVGFIMAPQIAAQSAQLAEKIPESIEQLRSWLGEYEWGRRLLGKADQVPDEAEAEQVVVAAAGFLRLTTEVIARVLIILFIGLYLAAEPETYKRGILHLVPKKKRERAEHVLNAVGFTLRWWLMGQLVAMFFVFVLSWIGLAALGVPLALTLAIISGLLTFIPFLGPILAAVPAILVGLMEGWQLALGVTILYVAIQNLEGYVITPLIQRKAVELPPALTLVAQILMILLLGFMGLVFAVPLAAAALVAVKMIYVQDILGDDIEVLKGRQEEQQAA